MTPLLMGGEGWKGLLKKNRKLVTGSFTCSEVLSPNVTTSSEGLKVIRRGMTSDKQWGYRVCDII